MFFKNLLNDPQYFIYWVCIIIFSVCFHEFCHAFIAYSQGDNTAKDEGFFTLNPMVHMGPIPLVMLFFTGMCWGACPVNPLKFKHKYSNALVSFAGPLGNVLLAIVFGLLYVIFSKFFNDYIVTYNLSKLFWYGCSANIALSIFNLIPLPPLDGHKVFEYIFPALSNFYESIGNIGFIFIFILFSIPIFGRIFWRAAYTLQDTLIDYIFKLGSCIKHIIM